MAASLITWAAKSTAATSPLPTTQKLTSADANEIRTAINNHAGLIDAVSGGSVYFGEDDNAAVNGVNVVVSGSTFPTTYNDGTFVTFQALGTNSGTSSAGLNGGLAFLIKNADFTDLLAGDIVDGQYYIMIFHGGGVNQWVLLNPSVFGAGGGGGVAEVAMLLSSSTDDPTSGHGVLKGVTTINGTDEILDPNTTSVLWYIDYDGTGYALANATGTLAGLKTDIEANLLLSSDVAMIKYVATEDAAYLGDMVNGFRYTPS
jgi:hypothetical protein